MVNNIFAFKNNFFKFDNVKEFHHELTNIVYLGREKALAGIVTMIIDIVALLKKKPFVFFLF